MTALNVMVSLGAFEKMPKQGSITAKELSALINLEASVIGTYPLCSQIWGQAANIFILNPVRIMRMLTATGIVALTGEDTYAHTPKSLAYCEGAAFDFWRLW